LISIVGRRPCGSRPRLHDAAASGLC
jgi:hypothetical protein